MAIYSDGYQDFYISIRAAEDIYHGRIFNCSTIIGSSNGRTVMTMASGKIFSSAAEAKAFGLDWAKSWIDNKTAGVDGQNKRASCAK
jgi:hypothetical protein